MWRTLSTSDTAFEREGVVIVAADPGLSRPGWTGVVVLGGAAVVTTPPALLDRVSAALAPVDDVALLTSRDFMAARFGKLEESRGPAVLAYGDVAPESSGTVAGPLDVGDRLVGEVLAGATADERDESGLAETESGVFVAVAGDRPVAASGFRLWPEQVAHMSVLTASTHRGRGFGRVAASAALDAASAADFVFQWRAVGTNVASIALAATLGLEQIGRQFSFRI
jgi:GNAT superfamily N-acetyltransferase